MTLVEPYQISAFARAAGPTLAVAVIISSVMCEQATAQRVPLPRPRPATAATAEPAPAPNREEPAPPSACRLRLTSELATALSLSPVTGTDGCGIDDPVRLEAIWLADKTRVGVTPPATVHCSFAEMLVQWVREDVRTALRSLAPLRSVENYSSYDCRFRNRIPGAKLSEHGKGNALDVRAIRLADGTVLELTDPKVAKDVREHLRSSACARFKTVLGPGSDGYHENHVHLDLVERRGGHRMCQWDVREPGEEPALGEARVPLPRPRPAAAPLPRPRPTAAMKR
jgi:hypothetical protein